VVENCGICFNLQEFSMYLEVSCGDDYSSVLAPTVESEMATKGVASSFCTRINMRAKGVEGETIQRKLGSR
jgi:hypothetical protein